MNYKKEFENNPLFFLENINREILEDLKNIDTEKSCIFKIYHGKKIINKKLKDKKITDLLTEKKINLTTMTLSKNIMKNSIVSEILNEKEMEIITTYFYEGVFFSFINFQNIIFYLEKIIRHLYLRIGISSAKHHKDQVLHYAELSNLIRKNECKEEIGIFFSCIMLPEGLNIRNKLIHGQYTEEKVFKYDMFILLLMVEIIINIFGEINEKEQEITFKY